MSQTAKTLQELYDSVNRAEYTLPENHELADAILILIQVVQEIESRKES